MSIAERIKEAREEAGLSIAELARRVGVTRSSAQQWESGASKGLKPENLVLVADALEVNMRWLATGQGPKRIVRGQWALPYDVSDAPAPVAPGPEIRGRVPLVSWTTAGHWAEVVDNFQPGDAEDWIVTTAHVGPQAFALRIQGDSMEPLIQDGSIVIVDPDTAPRHRSVVIVRQNDDREATCKRLVYDAGRPYLRPENPRYPAMEMADDAIIVGVVRQVIQELE